MSTRLKAILVAGSALLVYLAIGIAFRTNVGAIDQIMLACIGEATPLAIVFTKSAFLESLVAVSMLSLGLGLVYRAWLPRSIFAVVCDLLGWVVSDAGKHLFARTRPEHWLYRHETSFSYASGHALHAVVVYGLWALFFWRSNLRLPVRVVLTGSLTIWTIGIGWSRLALGAHFASDVAGGYVLGLAVVALGIACMPRILEPPPLKRSIN